MPISLIALVTFIATIIALNVWLKRNMAEAMGIGLLATTLFAGAEAPQYLWRGLVGALDQDVIYASLAFVFMAYLINQAALMDKSLAILNSMFGRLRGGPAHVETLGSALFGAVSGSNSANTASVGSFTGPWMVRTGWTPTRAATVLAGNGGLGAAIPPSASMLIMAGFATGYVTTGQIYLGLLASGLYQVLLRIGLVLFFIHRDNIPRIALDAEIPPLRQSLRKGLGAISIFFGALIPIVVTVGPVAEYLANSTPIGGALQSISLLTWIPILIILFALVAGRKELPGTLAGWSALIGGSMPRFASLGALLFFAVAASEILGELGLATDVRLLIETSPIRPVLLVPLVGLLIVVVAGPMSSTATLTAVGQVSFFSLIGAGLDPLIAVVAILVFASTEGASPPASGSIFVAAGLTGARPESTFGPLIIYYMIPVYVIGCLIGWGLLPIWRG